MHVEFYVAYRGCQGQKCFSVWDILLAAAVKEIFAHIRSLMREKEKSKTMKKYRISVYFRSLPLWQRWESKWHLGMQSKAVKWFLLTLRNAIGLRLNANNRTYFRLLLIANQANRIDFLLFAQRTAPNSHETWYISQFFNLTISIFS